MSARPIFDLISVSASMSINGNSRQNLGTVGGWGGGFEGGGGRSPTNLDLCLCALERLNKGHHPPALVRIGQAAAHGGEIVCHVRRIGGAGNNGRDPLVGE
jgi:hypothetical protein